MYGNSAAFFVVSTAFFTAAGQESYPCVAKIAYRGAQEEPVQVCGAGEGSNRRRQKNAGWARSGLHAVQRGRLRPSAARSAEAPDRRAPSPMPCKQTPLMEGAGNADIGSSLFLFYAALLSKRLRARSAEKQIRTRAADTIPPLSTISIMGVANTGRGPSVNSAWPEFSGGLPHDLTLYFLHNS